MNSHAEGKTQNAIFNDHANIIEQQRVRCPALKGRLEAQGENPQDEYVCLLQDGALREKVCVFTCL